MEASVTVLLVSARDAMGKDKAISGETLQGKEMRDRALMTGVVITQCDGF
ncbi:hypothetical protein QG37_07381 [Candidozyma auris]|uniref:Uncharacterized protein n=1 Tax=Candidozyma auris TaxID=498019 RepID=A0A0L0NQG1_CANAR|nr:hypothetical protein QG37_07381 [[Candida] auris]